MGAVSYRLWVNEERTVMIEMWENGTVTVAFRKDPQYIWGPPVAMEEEKVRA